VASWKRTVKSHTVKQLGHTLGDVVENVAFLPKYPLRPTVCLVLSGVKQNRIYLTVQNHEERPMDQTTKVFMDYAAHLSKLISTLLRSAD
jgi:hypothetical protein